MRLIMHRFEEPDHDGHRFYVECQGYHPEESRRIIDWCVERYGPAPESRLDYFGARWLGEGSFWFRDEQDAIEFKLRWC